MWNGSPIKGEYDGNAIRSHLSDMTALCGKSEDEDVAAESGAKRCWCRTSRNSNNRPGKREAEERGKERVEKKERRTRKRGVMRRRSDASLPQQHPKATTTLR